MINKIPIFFIGFCFGFCLLFQNVIAQNYSRIGPSDTKVYFDSGKKIFPRTWRNKKINPIATPVSLSEQARLFGIAQTGLQKYPANLLKQNLKKLYFLKTLMFFGLEYGGTYNKRSLYVTDNGIEKGYTDAYIEGTIHHEFSSIILKRYIKLFDEEAWIAANPTGFTYGDGGVEALKTEFTSLKLDSTLYIKGFLNEYSLASIEEDFNCYAEFLFISDKEFWLAWEQSEAVRVKTEILISFYNRIDPFFTLEYFRDGIPNLPHRDEIPHY